MVDVVGRRRGRLHRAAVFALAVGLGLGAFAFSSASRVADDNERRVFAQEATIEASAVSSLVVTVKSSVDSALVVAEATNGNADAFRKVAPDYFSSWVLMRATTFGWTREVVLGTPASDVPTDAAMTAKIAKIEPGKFGILGFLGDGDTRRLAVVEQSPQKDFLLYGEVGLPEKLALDPKVGAVAGSLPNLSYALYTDNTERNSSAVLTNTVSNRLPLTGRRAAVDIDMNTYGGGAKTTLHSKVGTAHLTPGHLLLVTSPHGPLTGGLANNFPWVLLGAVVLATILITTTAEVILRRRDDALLTIAKLEAQNEALDKAMAEQARAERERSALEEQLRAAHRLEAVGKLAGGVAHDFNNLLAVILNYASFAVEDLEGHPAQQDVNEVVGAARRATELTRQLLVFSRQDTVEPRVIAFNDVITNMQRLLERALEGDMDLRTLLDPGLAAVTADEGELEQVLMNLAVNARDAMREAGGTLMITTSNTVIDENDAWRHPSLDAGSYVQLMVRDTGAGMPDDVAARVFEPFFTTKGPGEGTGLGLSTVYGIVNRWGGEVTVKSTPGTGTVFTILFPASAALPDEARDRWNDGDTAAAFDAADAVDAAGATVLIVEDERAVRSAARRILEKAGYRVIEAETGAEALAWDDIDTVDVLLTDVVMPGGVSGRDLADEMLQRHPGLRVLFMSGYTADVISHRGVLDDGITLVDKPFTEQSLLDVVGRVLAAPTGARR